MAFEFHEPSVINARSARFLGVPRETVKGVVYDVGTTEGEPAEKEEPEITPPNLSIGGFIPPVIYYEKDNGPIIRDAIDAGGLEYAIQYGLAPSGTGSNRVTATEVMVGGVPHIRWTYRDFTITASINSELVAARQFHGGTGTVQFTLRPDMTITAGNNSNTNDWGYLLVIYDPEDDREIVEYTTTWTATSPTSLEYIGGAART